MLDCCGFGGLKLCKERGLKGTHGDWSPDGYLLQALFIEDTHFDLDDPAVELLCFLLFFSPCPSTINWPTNLNPQESLPSIPLLNTYVYQSFFPIPKNYTVQSRGTYVRRQTMNALNQTSSKEARKSECHQSRKRIHNSTPAVYPRIII